MPAPPPATYEVKKRLKVEEKTLMNGIQLLDKHNTRNESGEQEAIIGSPPGLSLHG